MTSRARHRAGPWLLAGLVAAGAAAAYESYHDPDTDDQGYCAACHPGFGGGPDDSLHLHHTGDPDPVTANCDLCHTGSGRDNPLTMWSIGGEQRGCAGCHGREYGETIVADYRGFPIAGLPKSSGHGLRKLHRNKGVLDCLFCHTDPGQSEILPESVDPLYFARADVSLRGLPASACSNDETLNDPDDQPLDNDGDLFRNLRDFDCQAGPTLTVGGACPGEATIQISGATPDGSLAVLLAVAAGSFELPSGPCRGSEVALDLPRLLTAVLVDGDGSVALTRTLPAAVCGAWLQFVDVATCQASNLANLPTAP